MLTEIAPHEVALVAKIRALPAEQLAQVEHFVALLQARDDDSELVRGAALASQAALAAVWDNDDDACYDAL